MYSTSEKGSAPRLGLCPRVAELDTALLGCEPGARAQRDHVPPGQGVQSEWIDVLSQRSDDERHALTYQPSNEADVAAEAVELGDANAWRASTQPQWRITVRLARDEGQSGTLYVTNRGQPFHPNNVDGPCEMGLSLQWGLTIRFVWIYSRFQAWQVSMELRGL